jgi:hypothetical protein
MRKWDLLSSVRTGRLLFIRRAVECAWGTWEMHTKLVCSSVVKDENKLLGIPRRRWMILK